MCKISPAHALVACFTGISDFSSIFLTRLFFDENKIDFKNKERKEQQQRTDNMEFANVNYAKQPNKNETKQERINKLTKLINLDDEQISWKDGYIAGHACGTAKKSEFDSMLEVVELAIYLIEQGEDIVGITKRYTKRGITYGLRNGKTLGGRNTAKSILPVPKKAQTAHMTPMSICI